VKQRARARLRVSLIRPFPWRPLRGELRRSACKPGEHDEVDTAGNPKLILDYEFAG
jgi:hypothetical protein